MRLHFLLIYDNSSWCDVQLQLKSEAFHLHFVLLHIGFCFGIGSEG